MIEILYNETDNAYDVWLDGRWLVQAETERGARQLAAITVAAKRRPGRSHR